MERGRRRFTRDFKLKVLREIESGAKPAVVARKYEIGTRLICKWQKNIREQGELAFARGRESDNQQFSVAELEQKVGRQQMEIDFLKKVLEHFETQLETGRGTGGVR